MRINLLLLLFPVSLFLSCGTDDPGMSPCELPSGNFTFQVNENSPGGTVVGSVAVTTTDGSVVSYVITSGNSEGIFSVNTAGELIVTNNSGLDYEKVQVFDLVVALSSPSCTGNEVMVRVNVLNEQDALYADLYFSDIVKEELIPYGIDDNDQVMNVYYPAEEGQAPRPVLVMAGGGAFYPSNLELLDAMARRMARAGYVVATIRYIADPDDEMDPSERFIIGVHDLKAAVRFFRKDADTDNLYNINPENIFLGGYGTGAFLSLPAVYAKENDFTTEEWTFIQSLGGLEGERGNPGYSSEVKALAPMAGAINDLDMIDAGEIPVICVHGDNDTQVSCQAGPNGSITVFGSCLIAERATDVGIVNELVLIAGGGHDAPRNCTNCYDRIMRFFLPYIE